MSEVAKRTRGRPKGAKNRNRIISGATVEQYCELHNHNPTQFLIDVARGKASSTFVPTPDDIMRANIKLHDSIHNGKAAGREAVGYDGEREQYEIVFVSEGSSGFSLPGETDAGSTEGVLPEAPLQRTSDSPQGWQDSICYQQTDN